MRLWLYCTAGLLFDWIVFAYLVVLPIRSEELGVSATELALLQGVFQGVYILGCLYVGRVADRASKSLLVRAGCVLAIAGCLLTSQATTLPMLFLVVPLLSLGGTLFWPSLQGALGAETDPKDMERALAIFNVMWCIGKTMGYATAGWLDARLGHGWTLAIAAAGVVPILLFYPRNLTGRSAPREEQGHPERTVYRTLGYMANFVAYGVNAAFSNQFFKYLDDTGLAGGPDQRKAYFGVFLGVISAAQTLMFVVLQRGSFWTYRRSWLYGALLLMAAATVGLTMTRSLPILLLIAPLVGIGIGFAYASSIYYSLHAPAEHGKYAGVHEAVLASGSLLIPLLGGRLADMAGDLRMPYWLAAGAALLAIVAAEGVYRRRSRS